MISIHLHSQLKKLQDKVKQQRLRIKVMDSKLVQKAHHKIMQLNQQYNQLKEKISFSVTKPCISTRKHAHLRPQSIQKRSQSIRMKALDKTTVCDDSSEAITNNDITQLKVNDGIFNLTEQPIKEEPQSTIITHRKLNPLKIITAVDEAERCKTRVDIQGIGFEYTPYFTLLKQEKENTSKSEYTTNYIKKIPTRTVNTHLETV